MQQQLYHSETVTAPLIGPAEALQVAEVLVFNETLKSLSIVGNHLGPAGIVAKALCPNTNTTPLALNLSDNRHGR